MRLRHWGALLGALAALVLLATAAQAGARETRSVLRATVTDVDVAGKPLGPVRPAGRAGRSLQASGCREVDVYRASTSFLFGAVVYRWHHTKRWCWSSGRVTGVWTSAFPTNVDPNWYYRGMANSAGYFYGGNTVHYSMRQARFENCILKFGCIGSEYPWVKIWANGDGSYRWETGT